MDENELTLLEASQLVSDLMYGPKKKGIIDAYSYVFAKYKIDYSYDEIKDYLFHHDLRKKK